MIKGQCAIGCCPVRSEASDRSEQITQLLFGETYSILEETENWVKIRVDYDGYEGWISANQSNTFLNPTPYTLTGVLFKEHNGHIIPMGSELTVPILDSLTKLEVVELARLFLNAPYLWGGKTFMGIDCSGLTQVVFKASGKKIPRDASQQFLCGETIGFERREKGDLAFFKNLDDKITHVGILSNHDFIIHASGKVREDKFDRKGIWREESNKYSHQLAGIRRIE